MEKIPSEYTGVKGLVRSMYDGLAESAADSNNEYIKPFPGGYEYIKTVELCNGKTQTVSGSSSAINPLDIASGRVRAYLSIGDTVAINGLYGIISLGIPPDGNVGNNPYIYMNSGGIFGYYGDEEAPWFMVAQRDVSIGGTDYHGGDFFIGNKDYAYLWWEHDEARLTIAGNVLIGGDIESANFEYDPGLGILNGYKLEYEGGNAYFGGAVISGSSSVGGRLATTIGSAIDSSGNLINDVINSNLSTASKQILGDFTFGTSGALQIGTYENGVSGDIRISPNGILGRNKDGDTTFSINGTTGDATFGGTLVAASGTFGTVTAGALSGVEISSSTITGGAIYGSTININNSWKVDSSGNMWWGGFSDYDSATYKISAAGVANLSGLVVGTNVSIGTAQDAAGVTTIIGNTVTTSYVNALNVTAGSVAAENITGTYITGKTIRTAISGQRVIVDGANNRIEFFTSSGSSCGYIYGSNIDYYPQINVSGYVYFYNYVTISGNLTSLGNIASGGYVSASKYLTTNGYVRCPYITGANGTIYFNQAGRIQFSTHVDPADGGSYNLGGSTRYWGDISYKTLTDRGCLGCFDDGVELQDGTIVSDIEAIRSIKKHPTKLTVYGKPMLDYKTFPKVSYKPATDNKGNLCKRDKNDQPYLEEFDEKTKKKTRVNAEDGVEMTSLFSIMIGAFKELDKKIVELEKEIKSLKRK